MHINQAPSPAADVKVEVIEGEILLYHPRQTKAVYLNPEAAVIWSLCDGQRSTRDIIRLIEEEYAASTATIAADVIAAIETLSAEGILEAR